MAAVVRNQWGVIEQRCGGDPGISRLDPASGGLGGNHHLGPLAAKVRTGGHDGEALDVEAQPVNALGTPPVLKPPTLDLGHGHERDASGTPGHIRVIELSDGMVLEEERKNVGIDDDFGHAAGAVRFRPRHSWRVARNSSMDSSSGQKSPCSKEMSVMGPVPCSAISCANEGCPVAE